MGAAEGTPAGPADSDWAGRELRRSLSVVLVDDHEVVLDGLSRALQREDMQVVGSFLEAEPAIEFLGAHDVDLLVVDLRLKTGSGADLVERAHRKWPNLRIAVLTSFEDGVAAAAVMRAGASGFLLKDALSEELSHRLRGVAEGSVIIDSRLVDAVLQPTQISLSATELTILRLVAEGRTNREIGAEMHLSPYTIKDYLTRTMRTLGTRTRAETVARASQEGLLDTDEG
ncbi:response regulator transcription factor [Saccharopolyspora sp. NPDC049426]|uniref:response regulator transcription factor n=1 Tax=Saccharopolyspora sp. NPDC049426 TaxID=3155652 RepID=UPI00342831B8